MTEEDFFRRLVNDKSWRTNNLYSIVDKNKQQVTFKKNRAQQHFEKNRAGRNIILKSRQLGFTTYEAIDMLDDALFGRNYEGLFIAHTQEDAQKIFDKKVDYTWRVFDDDLKYLWKVVADRANRLKFDFGDNSNSSITVANSGRSGTYNRVHVSEYAKLCATYPMRADEIISGTIPSTPVDGRFDIESTAEGMGGHFSDMFWEAWGRGEPRYPTEFKAHFYNWTWDDEEISKVTKIIPTALMDEPKKFAEYQLLHKLTDLEITYYYLKWISVKKDWNILRQEYPTTPEEAFITSGTPYFDNERIFILLKSAKNPIAKGNLYLNCTHDIACKSLSVCDELSWKFKEEEDGKLKIWEYPDTNKSYTIGGDVAEGVGGDASVADVINTRTLSTVAEFCSNSCPPDEFTYLLYALGCWYNNAYTGIEVNKDGLWVNTELFKMNYSNLYFREEIDDIESRVKRKVGFRTDARTRDVILSGLKQSITEISDGYVNEQFLRECLTFVRNERGRAEAMQGKHDDRVLAKAIALFIRRFSTFAEIKQEPETSEMIKLVAERLRMLKRKGNNDIINEKKYY